MQRRHAISLLGSLVLDRWWQDYKAKTWPDMNPAERERARPSEWVVHLDQTQFIVVELGGKRKRVSVRELFEAL